MNIIKPYTLISEIRNQVEGTSLEYAEWKRSLTKYSAFMPILPGNTRKDTVSRKKKNTQNDK